MEITFLSPAVLLAGVALGIAVFALFATFSLQRRMRSSLAGADGQNIERSLAKYFQSVNKLDAKHELLAKSYQDLSAKAELASQKISIVRFNPFGDTGGDQSFVLAVLDNHHSGYVLTSIHGREGTRVYIKPIDFGKSKYTLSREEQQAIAQATKRVPKVQNG